MTGSGVSDATIPGRCAAPPAPAMITLIPRSAAPRAYSSIRSGVRWADTTVTSHATPKSSSTAAASAMTGRSESEPMMIPT